MEKKQGGKVEVVVPGVIDEARGDGVPIGRVLCWTYKKRRATNSITLDDSGSVVYNIEYKSRNGKKQWLVSGRTVTRAADLIRGRKQGGRGPAGWVVGRLPGKHLFGLHDDGPSTTESTGGSEPAGLEEPLTLVPDPPNVAEDSDDESGWEEEEEEMPENEHSTGPVPLTRASNFLLPHVFGLKDNDIIDHLPHPTKDCAASVLHPAKLERVQWKPMTRAMAEEVAVFSKSNRIKKSSKKSAAGQAVASRLTGQFGCSVTVSAWRNQLTKISTKGGLVSELLAKTRHERDAPCEGDPHALNAIDALLVCNHQQREDVFRYVAARCLGSDPSRDSFYRAILLLPGALRHGETVTGDVFATTTGSMVTDFLSLLAFGQMPKRSIFAHTILAGCQLGLQPPAQGVFPEFVKSFYSSVFFYARGNGYNAMRGHSGLRLASMNVPGMPAESTIRAYVKRQLKTVPAMAERGIDMTAVDDAVKAAPADTLLCAQLDGRTIDHRGGGDVDHGSTIRTSFINLYRRHQH